MMKRRPLGFTLLEMLLALLLFSLLSLAAYQVLQGVLRNGEISREKATQLADLQQTMSVIERDFSQSIVSEEIGFSVLSDQTQDIVTLVRANWLNPGGVLSRSQLEQVSYRLHQGTLERHSAPYPTGPNTRPTVTKLLEEVDVFQLRFFQQGQWQRGWGAAQQLPEGIEVRLDMRRYGRLYKRVMPTAPREALP